MSAVPVSRRQRSRALGLCMAAALLIAAPRVFVPAGAPTEVNEVGRRSLFGSVAPAVLGLAAQEASAIPRVTDVDAYVNNRKLEIVPVFKQGIDYLESKGIDDRMIAFMPRLIRKMKIYANIFSMEEAPDKRVRQLEKDVEVFRVAVEEKKDKALALEAFDKYRTDIPPGTGSFDLKVPSTFEAPPP